MSVTGSNDTKLAFFKAYREIFISWQFSLTCLNIINILIFFVIDGKGWLWEIYVT